MAHAFEPNPNPAPQQHRCLWCQEHDSYWHCPRCGAETYVSAKGYIMCGAAPHCTWGED